jgi:drug/metabolite transporter (DMT)-like permease
MRTSSSVKAYGVLALGVVIASWASILIRWAGEASPLVIAAGRLVLASAILTPVALATGAYRELRALGRRDLLLAVLSGAALAIHFASWISSLSLTTVASSVVLVATSPIFVGLASHFFLGERVSRLAAGGIIVAVIGSVFIGYGDFGLSRQALMGDLLALVGALMTTAYLLLGRRLRRRLSILAYVWPVYCTAALVLTAICLLTGQPFGGYAPVTYWMFLLLAVGPQLLGHSSFNYALGYLSTSLVAVAALGEPVGATILAYLLLEEAPAGTALIGGFLILIGIALSVWEEGRRTQNESGQQ